MPVVCTPNDCSVSQKDKSFIEGPFARIFGWCHSDAAYLTCYLLDAQPRGHGPLVEIGVYRGKYFSVLAHKAAGSSRKAIGIDTFQGPPPEAVVATLLAAVGSLDAVGLAVRNTLTLTASDFMNLLEGQRAGFISIDGDHSPAGVAHDLTLAAAALDADGIVAVDDFLNPQAIGVSEGAFRALLAGELDLRPFAYCANKLFLSKAATAELYKGVAYAFAQTALGLRSCAQFSALVRRGRSWVEQELLGGLPVIIGHELPEP